MLKIQRTANGEVIFALSGRLEADTLRELRSVLASECSGRPVALELKDLVLVDRDAVGLLRACEQKGIALRNCPLYIRTWMACHACDERRDPGGH
jgi:ABC-type transporter Mla MlaB component